MKASGLIISMACLVSAQAFAAKPAVKAKASKVAYDQLETLAQVLHFVDTNYINRSIPSPWIEFAIRGVVDRLDQYSRFFSPEELAREQAKERSVQLGIGIRWAFEKGRCLVSDIRVGSAAHQAGVKIGDEIVKVNGLSPLALGAEAFRVFMEDRSEKWTKMNLRSSAGELRKIRVAPPEVEYIRAEELENGVTVLRIGRFFAGAETAVRLALQASGEKSVPKRLVIDLRGNTGGVVDEAVRVSDLWLKKGLISIMIDASGHRHESVARAGDDQPEYPIVVLVDGKTASAAEVLAAALSENNRAKVVGTQTFGKATVQTLIRFTDGSALRLTVGRLLTPDGRSIGGLGLPPDVQVLPGRTPDGLDRQLIGACNAVLYP